MGGIYHTKTKRHDDMGVVVFGPIAVPVSLLIVFGILGNIPVLILCAMGDNWWGWNGVGFLIYGILWGLVGAAFALYALFMFVKWVWTELRDANDWRAPQRRND